jgi:glucuronokinase
MVVSQQIGARVGLIGNPSDGFGGKTIACLIRNFGACVTVRESRALEIVRHPFFDPLAFSSLDDLAQTASNDGYYGGIRLLFATCKKFHDWCHERAVELDDRNFILQYDTTIPRQVGLAGSSAIITATLKALMQFYGITEADIPKVEQPNFVLSVETEELGISAGLQDRVVQTYGGLLYMDFNTAQMQTYGHGYYESMPLDLLPPMYLAYDRQGSDSGSIHSGIRYRFDRGDYDVIEGMRQFAQHTDEGRKYLEERDHERLGALMNADFDLRRRLYGDDYIGARNLEMIGMARSLGLSSRFPGSGGAIIGICEDEGLFDRASLAFENAGYSFARLHPCANDPCPVTWNGAVQTSLESLIDSLV